MVGLLVTVLLLPGRSCSGSGLAEGGMFKCLSGLHAMKHVDGHIMQASGAWIGMDA